MLVYLPDESFKTLKIITSLVLACTAHIHCRTHNGAQFEFNYNKIGNIYILTSTHGDNRSVAYNVHTLDVDE